ncbi:hypothetical protein D4764_19G0005760 [Takifugu flavidus]|uniref:Uncharacterized protein n=1 Tax=Takifugu flavidus TaxID=433684 RepID=A0A5C6NQ01_9TELE|nr:hypothetical protein D4764_19G0005760 [Takifugu flavidus]
MVVSYRYSVGHRQGSNRLGDGKETTRRRGTSWSAQSRVKGENASNHTAKTDLRAMPQPTPRMAAYWL